MPRSLPSGLTDTLLWSDELGYGWHTRPAMSYDGDYFAHYQELDATPMGAALTAARVAMVRRYCDPAWAVDIGIGGGRFVVDSGSWGFDVSEQGATWLRDIGRYADPYRGQRPYAVTCWDSLEHIPDPEALLAQVTDWLFVSMPVYATLGCVLRSKHYKPGEHLWYFSATGFVSWAERLGFHCVEINHRESELGREGIASFAFRRVSDGG